MTEIFDKLFVERLEKLVCAEEFMYQFIDRNSDGLCK